MRLRAYIFFALLTALSTGTVAQPFWGNALPSLPYAHAANRSISLVGNLAGWNNSLPSGKNPTITVSQGDMITISLTSVDALHQFALDVDGDGAKFTGACSTGDSCSPQFNTMNGASISIDTSSLSGTYTYFCTFHSGMVGSFVVVGGTVGGVTIPTNRTATVTPYLIFALAVGALVVAVVAVNRSRRHRPPTST